MVEVWHLIENGRFDDACVAADKEAAGSTSLLPLRNKVLALLNLERYEEAAQTCREVIRRDGADTDSDFIYLGVACWLRSEYDEAVTAWQSATNTTYTDAAGGVEIPLMLLYASTKLENEELKTRSLKKLRSLCKKPSSVWPRPVADYMLGTLTEDDVRSRISAQPILRARQLCNAAFYFGLERLMWNDADGCRQFMQEACAQSTSSLLEHEYYLAKAETR
jgi:hypothetical protein